MPATPPPTEDPPITTESRVPLDPIAPPVVIDAPIVVAPPAPPPPPVVPPIPSKPATEKPTAETVTRDAGKVLDILASFGLISAENLPKVKTIVALLVLFGFAFAGGYWTKEGPQGVDPNIIEINKVVKDLLDKTEKQGALTADTLKHNKELTSQLQELKYHVGSLQQSVESVKDHSTTVKNLTLAMKEVSIPPQKAPGPKILPPPVTPGTQVIPIVEVK